MRQRLTKEVRESQILDAAAELFRERRSYAASTLEIAQKANVVEGTLFRYFPTKRELLLRLAERSYQRTLADYDEQLAGIKGTWNRLRYMAWRQLKNIQDDPVLYRFIHNDIKLDPEFRSTRIFHLHRSFTKRTLEIVKTAMDTGEFLSDIPVRLVRDTIYGAIDHHVWRYVRGDGSINIDRIADDVTTLVYRGLASQKGDHKQEEAASKIESRLARIETKLNQLAKASEKA